MQNFTVCFFGHKNIEKSSIIEHRLEDQIRVLLLKNEYVEFLVGRDGDFDMLVASVIRRCKKQFRDDNSSLIWVLPYMTSQLRDNQEAYENYYDEIEVCGVSATAHYKSAFQIRNKAIIDRSELAIFYVEHPSGGAYKTMQYAMKQNKKIINVADCTFEKAEFLP